MARTDVFDSKTRATSDSAVFRKQLKTDYFNLLLMSADFHFNVLLFYCLTYGIHLRAYCSKGALTDIRDDDDNGDDDDDV